MPSGQPSPASPSGSSSSSMTASYLSVPIPGNRMSRPTAMVALLIVVIEEYKGLKTNALSPWRKWASSSGAPRRGRGAWAPRRGRPAGPGAARQGRAGSPSELSACRCPGERQRCASATQRRGGGGAAGAAATTTTGYRGGRRGGADLAGLHPEHLVLGVVALRPVGVDGQLDVNPLLEVRGDAAQVERVGPGRIQSRCAPATGVAVLADEDLGVGQQHLVIARPQRGRMRREGDARKEVALVVAVEVDGEDARNVRLVVGRAVGRLGVDLDGAVVAWWACRVGGRCARDLWDRQAARDEHRGEQTNERDGSVGLFPVSHLGLQPSHRLPLHVPRPSGTARPRKVAVGFQNRTAKVKQDTDSDLGKCDFIA